MFKIKENKANIWCAALGLFAAGIVALGVAVGAAKGKPAQYSAQYSTIRNEAMGGRELFAEAQARQPDIVFFNEAQLRDVGEAVKLIADNRLIVFDGMGIKDVKKYVELDFDVVPDEGVSASCFCILNDGETQLWGGFENVNHDELLEAVNDYWHQMRQDTQAPPEKPDRN